MGRLCYIILQGETNNETQIGVDHPLFKQKLF